jgi:hypothetical protein
MMSGTWLKESQKNPMPALLEWEDDALRYFVHRDLMDESTPKLETLWELPEPTNLAEKTTR